MIHSFKGLSKSLLFIDSFMVLLNLSTSYSIIPYLLFGQYDRYVNMLLFLGFNILYVSVRFNKPFTIPRKDALFYIYLILNVCNFFFGYFDRYRMEVSIDLFNFEYGFLSDIT